MSCTHARLVPITAKSTNTHPDCSLLRSTRLRMCRRARLPSPCRWRRSGRSGPHTALKKHHVTGRLRHASVKANTTTTELLLVLLVCEDYGRVKRDGIWVLKWVDVAYLMYSFFEFIAELIGIWRVFCSRLLVENNCIVVKAPAETI